MVDLKYPKKFLGIELLKDSETNAIFLRRRMFIEKLLKRFKLDDCNSVKTPCVTNKSERKGIKRKLDNYIDSDLKDIPFCQCIGSLLYLANATRPDLTFVVNKLRGKQANYDWNDWLEIKIIFRYLAGTKNLGLKFEGKNNKIECFVDASLGTNDELGKSTTGLILMLFGDPIFWRTKKQTHVVLSTMESEFIAMSLAAKELISLREMCIRLIKIDTIPIMYEDSQVSQSLKHVVNLCYHYIRFEVAQRNLIIEWIKSEDQLADMFTKALGHEKFSTFRSKIRFP